MNPRIGHLFPVAPTVVNLIRGLFALNERVALLGKWQHGFYSLIPVGATNVGSIELSIEPVLAVPSLFSSKLKCKERKERETNK